MNRDAHVAAYTPFDAEWLEYDDATRPSPKPLDERRRPCRCEPWAQRWRADHPEVCVNCGGLFAARTVPARRLTDEEVERFGR